jgi:hypothetical protein
MIMDNGKCDGSGRSEIPREIRVLLGYTYPNILQSLLKPHTLMVKGHTHYLATFVQAESWPNELGHVTTSRGDAVRFAMQVRTVLPTSLRFEICFFVHNKATPTTYGYR